MTMKTIRLIKINPAIIQIAIALSPVIVLCLWAAGFREDFVRSLVTRTCWEMEIWEKYYWGYGWSVNSTIGSTWSGMALTCPAIIIVNKCLKLFQSLKFKTKSPLRCLIELILVVMVCAPLPIVLMLLGYAFFPFEMP